MGKKTKRILALTGAAMGSIVASSAAFADAASLAAAVKAELDPAVAALWVIGAGVISACVVITVVKLVKRAL